MDILIIAGGIFFILLGIFCFWHTFKKRDDEPPAYTYASSSTSKYNQPKQGKGMGKFFLFLLACLFIYAGIRMLMLL